MKKSSLSLIGSVFFLIVIIASFYSIWRSSSDSKQTSNKAFVSSYAPVDISGIKNQAIKIISKYQNNSGIPIPTPTDKMGRENPFNDPE